MTATVGQSVQTWDQEVAMPVSGKDSSPSTGGVEADGLPEPQSASLIAARAPHRLSDLRAGLMTEARSGTGDRCGNGLSPEWGSSWEARARRPFGHEVGAAAVAAGIPGGASRKPGSASRDERPSTGDQGGRGKPWWQEPHVFNFKCEGCGDLRVMFARINGRLWCADCWRLAGSPWPGDAK